MDDNIRQVQLTKFSELSSIGLNGTTEISALGPRLALVTIEPAMPAAPPKPSFAERLGNFWCSLYVEPMPKPRDYL